MGMTLFLCLSDKEGADDIYSQKSEIMTGLAKMRLLSPGDILYNNATYMHIEDILETSENELP